METGSAAERAYRWARGRILDGTFEPGAMVTEGEVSEQVGVSRTPVREAFLRLSTEGFLRLYPKRGAVVVPLTDHDTHDMLDARALIEPWAAGEAAGRGGGDRAALVEALRSYVDELVAAGKRGDTVAYHEADRAFHEAIVDATGNRLVGDFYRTIRDRQLRVGAAALAGAKTRGRSILAEHREILAAIEAGDAEAAGRAVAAHVESTRRAFARRRR